LKEDTNGIDRGANVNATQVSGGINVNPQTKELLLYFVGLWI